MHRATHDIQQTISANLTDLKSLEHNLTEHQHHEHSPAPDNSLLTNPTLGGDSGDKVDRASMRSASRGGLSRHSTKLDMTTPARKAGQGSQTTLKQSHSKTSLTAMQQQQADSTSVTAINMMPESEMQMQGDVEDVMEEDEEAYMDDDESQADDDDMKMR